MTCHIGPFREAELRTEFILENLFPFGTQEFWASVEVCGTADLRTMELRLHSKLHACPRRVT